MTLYNKNEMNCINLTLKNYSIAGMNKAPKVNYKQIFSFPFILIIKIYQLTLSPFIGRSCRYTPTCSEYGIEALKKYGPVKGGWLTLKRIVSCNPWGGHGHDPVP